jgi:hypothetical protein
MLGRPARGLTATVVTAAWGGAGRGARVGGLVRERNVNLCDPNQQNMRAVRDIDSRAQWQEIKELAEEISTRRSRGTKLGEAVPVHLA